MADLDHIKLNETEEAVNSDLLFPTQAPTGEKWLNIPYAKLLKWIKQSIALNGIFGETIAEGHLPVVDENGLLSDSGIDGPELSAAVATIGDKADKVATKLYYSIGHLAVDLTSGIAIFDQAANEIFRTYEGAENFGFVFSVNGNEVISASENWGENSSSNLAVKNAGGEVLTSYRDNTDNRVELRVNGDDVITGRNYNGDFQLRTTNLSAVGAFDFLTAECFYFNESYWYNRTTLKNNGSDVLKIDDDANGKRMQLSNQGEYELLTASQDIDYNRNLKIINYDDILVADRFDDDRRNVSLQNHGNVLLEAYYNGTDEFYSTLQNNGDTIFHTFRHSGSPEYGNAVLSTGYYDYFATDYNIDYESEDNAIAMNMRIGVDGNDEFKTAYEFSDNPEASLLETASVEIGHYAGKVFQSTYERTKDNVNQGLDSYYEEFKMAFATEGFASPFMRASREGMLNGLLEFGLYGTSFIKMAYYDPTGENSPSLYFGEDNPYLYMKFFNQVHFDKGIGITFVGGENTALEIGPYSNLVYTPKANFITSKAINAIVVSGTPTISSSSPTAVTLADSYRKNWGTFNRSPFAGTMIVIGTIQWKATTDGTQTATFVIANGSTMTTIQDAAVGIDKIHTTAINGIRDCGANEALTLTAASSAGSIQIISAKILVEQIP